MGSLGDGSSASSQSRVQKQGEQRQTFFHKMGCSDYIQEKAVNFAAFMVIMILSVLALFDPGTSAFFSCIVIVAPPISSIVQSRLLMGRVALNLLQGTWVEKKTGRKIDIQGRLVLREGNDYPGSRRMIDVMSGEVIWITGFQLPSCQGKIEWSDDTEELTIYAVSWPNGYRWERPAEQNVEDGSGN